MRAISLIRAGLPRLAAACADADMTTPTMSSWSIGQHLDHVIKVHVGILAYFAQPPVGETTGRGITLIGRIVLFSGHIPRGRGKSPPDFLPAPMTAVDLRAAITAVDQSYIALVPQVPRLAGSTLRFVHPVFGGLDRRQWLRFAGIHQRHHQAIIDDIQRARSASAR